MYQSDVALICNSILCLNNKIILFSSLYSWILSILKQSIIASQSKRFEITVINITAVSVGTVMNVQSFETAIVKKIYNTHRDGILLYYRYAYSSESMENIDSFTIFIYKYISTYYTYTLVYPQKILRVPLYNIICT